MPNRSLYPAALLTLVLLASCTPGQKSEPIPTRVEAPSATTESLPENERPFVGRWCVDLERMSDSGGESLPADPVAFTVFQTLLLDFDADHKAYGYCGIGAAAGTWSLSGDTVTLNCTAPNFRRTTLTRTGDEVRCVLGGENKPVVMKRAPAGTPIDPASLTAQWNIDIDATAAATDRGLRTMERLAKAAYGNGDQIPPLPTVTPQAMKAQLAQLFQGRSPVIALAAAPGSSDGGVGEIRGVARQPMAFTYTIHRDMILFTDASGKEPGSTLQAFRVVDGKLTWDLGTATLVFHK